MNSWYNKLYKKKTVKLVTRPYYYNNKKSIEWILEKKQGFFMLSLSYPHIDVQEVIGTGNKPKSKFFCLLF